MDALSAADARSNKSTVAMVDDVDVDVVLVAVRLLGYFLR